MVFKHLVDNDKNSLKLESYTVAINEETSSKLYNHLFGTIDIVANTNSAIIDDMLNSYIKTVVADEFSKQIKLVKGNIYKISIVTHIGNTIEMMLSLHDKLNEVFY
jgi:hypothetical protein